MYCFNYNYFCKGRLIAVFGCGGDRDPIKRPIMGNIASELSDYCIFTSDNPRTENPENILNDILSGVKKDNYEVIVDRKNAIHEALSKLNKDDILLILGKGHEDYMIIKDEKIYFSDRETILCIKNH